MHILCYNIYSYFGMRKNNIMYNFDEIIGRENTNALSVDGFKRYMFKNDTIELPYKDNEIIRMWLADMEFATPDFIIEGVKNRLDKKILGYTEDYYSEYYEVFSNWTKTYYDWHFPREYFTHSIGIIPAMEQLIGLITEPNEQVLTFTPTYAPFKTAVENSNRQLICSKLINSDYNYSIDFDNFKLKAQNPKTKVFIFCNPHNPTGKLWTEEEIKEIAHICQENNLWVISDEIHCDLLRSNKKHIPMAKIMGDYPKLITCMSPSKTFNVAGLMTANLIIPDKIIRESWLKKYDEFQNPLSLAGAQAAYEKGGQWLQELKEYLDKNFELTKEYLTTNLPLAKFNIPDATYLAWIDVSAYLGTEKNLALFFAHEAGVLVADGSMFLNNAEGFIRINLACPRKMLIQGLEGMHTAISTHIKQDQLVFNP